MCVWWGVGWGGAVIVSPGSPLVYKDDQLREFLSVAVDAAGGR